MGNFWGIVFGLMLICLGVGAVFGVNLWRYFFPAFLIFLGLNILFNRLGWKNHERWEGNWRNRMVTVETHENLINYDTVFNGIEKKVVSKNFQGGKVTSVFGGTVLDLREAQMSKNGQANLEVSAVFGGVKVLVPKNWSVEGNLSGVFGGFDNSTVYPEKPEGRLNIKGAAVFGGGEISN